LNAEAGEVANTRQARQQFTYHIDWGN